MARAAAAAASTMGTGSSRDVALEAPAITTKEESRGGINWCLIRFAVDALSLDDFDGESAAYDAVVLGSAGVDFFCSSSDWILPAARGLMPARAPWLRRGQHGYVALMRNRRGGDEWLEPLEAMWGLACPIAGDPLPLAAELAAELGRSPPAALMLCGLERASPRFAALARSLQGRYQLALGPAVRRFVASLEGGVDGFLSRRTPNFRRSLTRALRRAGDLVFVADPTGDYQRLLAVEARSWKGLDAVGILASEMVEFYRHMIPRLVRRGALRLMYAQKDGEDVAYILGGIFGGVYRGLQFSFAAGHEALSLGNLCQYHQIASLCAEGIGAYDLGAEVEYKRRWGERIHETVTLLAFPSP
jgi:CelD/BcsL family acetyltransferase involved in cellulose biosynthesis